MQRIMYLLIGLIIIAIAIGGARWSKGYQEKMRAKDPKKLFARYGFVYGIWFGIVFVLMGIRFIVIAFS